MNIASNIQDFLVFVNNSTGGFFGYSFLVLIGLVAFTYFKQNREFIIASAYSLFFLVITSFLFILLEWVDINVVWALGLLTVINIMIIYFKKGE